MAEICRLRPNAFPDDAAPWPFYKEWLKSKHGLTKLNGEAPGKLQDVLAGVRILAEQNTPPVATDEDPFADAPEDTK